MSDLTPTIDRLVRERIMQQERLVSRMLTDWTASIFGEPVLVFDWNHDIVGLTSEPLSRLGEPVEIVLRASDYQEHHERN